MIDDELQRKASELFASLGMDYDAAVEYFLRTALERNKMPIDEHLIGTLTRNGAIASLSDPFFRVYYVDLDTDHFLRVSAPSDGKGGLMREEGDFFFKYFVDHVSLLVHPNDLIGIIHYIDKQAWLDIGEHQVVSYTHRSNEFGSWHYHTIRGVKIEGHYLVIGVAHSDDSIRREKELKQRIRKAKLEANVDSLTGLYNHRFFAHCRSHLNGQIRKGQAHPFAVVVCDLNNLKYINDTAGHQAGDEYIKEGADQLRHAFPSSKVFRIGGDEFVILAENDVVGKCDAIVGRLIERSRKALKNGHCVIAVGVSHYHPGQDQDFSAVFQRADMAMYANKAELKKKDNK